MRLRSKLLLTAGLLAFTGGAQAQRPEKPADKPKPSAGAELVVKMLGFDKNKDGELTKEEVTDERLMKLFERADKNKDGKVTKDELIALVAAEGAGATPGGGRPGGGPGGPPGGGFPGMGGPPTPGQVMPEFVARQLKLTDDQKKKFAELQKELDAKLEKILTDDQKKMFREMKERGPMGGPGGRPGEGGGRPGGEGPGRPGQPGKPGGEGDRKPGGN